MVVISTSDDPWFLRKFGLNSEFPRQLASTAIGWEECRDCDEQQIGATNTFGNFEKILEARLRSEIIVKPPKSFRTSYSYVPPFL
jgi:hypothetical protein